MSDEGFALAYGNRSVTYSDDRGAFQFGFEDGFLFPSPKQLNGEPLILDERSLDMILERVARGIRSEGHSVEIYPLRQS